MPEVGELAGKVALVTGGGAGIGRAICLKLARMGAAVAVMDVREEAAAGVVSEIEGTGGRGLAVACDVTDYSAVTATVDRVVLELGVPYILVNNAGIDIVRMFVDTDEALWRRLTDVNYIGFLAVTHAVAPKMIENKSGLMINIGSDAGRIGNPGDAVYCGTKAAMMATSKAFAREFARHGIRVNCVAPGATQVRFSDDPEHQAAYQRFGEKIPFGRVGTPRDVAQACLFLSDPDKSGYITGSVIRVDGGLILSGMPEGRNAPSWTPPPAEKTWDDSNL